MKLKYNFFCMIKAWEQGNVDEKNSKKEEIKKLLFFKFRTVNLKKKFFSLI